MTFFIFATTLSGLYPKMWSNRLTKANGSFNLMFIFENALKYKLAISHKITSFLAIFSRFRP